MDNAHFWFQPTDGGGGGGDAGDPIGESLRFRRGVTYFAPKTFGQTTNINSTHSLWIKFGRDFNSSNYCSIFGDFNSWLNFGPQGTNRFNSNGAVVVHPGVWNDRSAWHHIVFQTNNNSFWINGVLIASQTGYATTSNKYTLGSEVGTAVNNLDGYMAEVHHVDGKLLPPTTFGRFNANGIWVPVDPKKDGDTAWYGTNGFHLTFADPGNVGKDYSGNGNDFTATGFETANQTSVDYDIMQDSPTNNFATLNPIECGGQTTYFGILADANLASAVTQSYSTIHPVTIKLSGQYYCEFIATSGAGAGALCLRTAKPGLAGSRTGVDTYLYTSDGRIYEGSVVNAGGPVITTGATWTVNDVIGMAFDFDTNQLRYYKNGVEQCDVTISPAGSLQFGVYNNSGAKPTINFGQQPFKYTPPEGFLPLSTANMPTDELPDVIEGEYIANGVADGTFVYTGCIPGKIEIYSASMVLNYTIDYVDRLSAGINSKKIDFLSNGFKIRTTDTAINNTGRTFNYKVYTTHTGGEYDGEKVPFNAPAPAVSN